MSLHRNPQSQFMVAVSVLAAMILLRLATLGSPDLLDATEGRYAVIAQDMWTSGNWITPMVRLREDAEPFWGKPPFHFWLSAVSLGVFGMNEWAARFPSFLASLIMAFATFLMGARLFGREVGIIAALILWSAGLLNVLAGSTTVDVTLAATIAVALASFTMLYWPREGGRSSAAALSFSISIALGFLTKGPLSVVLVGAVIALFSIATRSMRPIRVLPWRWGAPLALLITVPWFVAAEHATPGFLRYFFIEENLLRYLTPNYHDLYGNGHRYPFGSAWWMLWVAFLPWSLSLFALPRNRGGWRALGQSLHDQKILFCAISALTPPLFFTLAHQILITYLLPALPAAALLIAVVMGRVQSPSIHSAMKWLSRGILIAAALLALNEIVIEQHVRVGLASLTLVLLAGGMLFHWTGREGSSSLDRVARTGCCAAILISVVVLAGRDEADERKSTRLVLDYVAEHSGQTNAPHQPLRLGIFSLSSYSAFFYASAEHPNKFDIALLSDARPPPLDLRDLLIRTRDLGRLSPLVLREGTLVSTIGPWLWIKFSTPPSAAAWKVLLPATGTGSSTEAAAHIVSKLHTLGPAL